MPNGKPTIAFIGFGEAGQAIAAGLREAGVETMSAWDILFPQAAGEKLKQAAQAGGVRCANSAADTVRGVDLIISAVTAASSLERRSRSRRILPARRIFSTSTGLARPQAGHRKAPRRCRPLCRRRGTGADLSARHETPMLLAGPHAGAIAAALASLGMRVSIAGAETGGAAAIKMVRSVMIKGIEALTLECFLAASRAGVIDEVAASMKNNYPGLDWAKIVPYNLERMANHGERRAAEMEEVADTLRELGVEPLMTSATVKRQREMGQIGSQQSVRGVLNRDRATMLGAISAAARDRH